MSTTQAAASAPKTQEQIIAEFQHLRNEQRNLVTNITKLEVDLKEHKTVIETLATVDVGRKCYRLIGGVLCARTVKDVLPELTQNKDQLENMVTRGNEQLTKKSQEINKFVETHNIRIKGQPIDKSEVTATSGDAESAADRKQLLITN